MPQYAILQSHPPGDCPVSSKAARQWFKKIFPEIENVAKQFGVKFVVPYIHLDPAHKALLLLEAPSAEAARDFVARAGFVQFTDMEFYLTTPVAELYRQIDDLPTVYD